MIVLSFTRRMVGYPCHHRGRTNPPFFHSLGSGSPSCCSPACHASCGAPPHLGLRSLQRNLTHTEYLRSFDPIEIKKKFNCPTRHRGYNRTITTHKHTLLYGHIWGRFGRKATVSVLTRGSDEGQSALKLFSAEEVMGRLPVLSPYNGVQWVRLEKANCTILTL